MSSWKHGAGPRQRPGHSASQCAHCAPHMLCCDWWNCVEHGRWHRSYSCQDWAGCWLLMLSLMSPASNCVRGQGEGAMLSGQNMQWCMQGHYVASSLHAHTGTRRHFDISNRNHARIQEYKMTHHDTWTWLFMHLTYGHGRSHCTLHWDCWEHFPLPLTLHQSTVCLLCGLFEWFSSTVIAMEYQYFWFDYTLCNKNCMFMGGQTFKPRSIIKQHKTYCLSTLLDLIDRKAASWRVTSGVRGIEGKDSCFGLLTWQQSLMQSPMKAGALYSSMGRSGHLSLYWHYTYLLSMYRTYWEGVFNRIRNLSEFNS